MTIWSFEKYKINSIWGKGNLCKVVLYWLQNSEIKAKKETFAKMVWDTTSRCSRRWCLEGERYSFLGNTLDLFLTPLSFPWKSTVISERWGGGKSQGLSLTRESTTKIYKNIYLYNTWEGERQGQKNIHWLFLTLKTQLISNNTKRNGTLSF